MTRRGGRSGDLALTFADQCLSVFISGKVLPLPITAIPAILNSLFQRRRRAQVFDLHAQDAVAVHLQYGKAAAVVFETLAALGDPAELGHDEAGKGFKAVFARQSDVILRLKIAQVEAAVEHD